MTPGGAPATAALRPLLREFLAYGRWRVPAAIALMLVVGALEAVGFLLLAPMLALLGMPDGGPAHALASVLGALRLEWTLPLAFSAYVILIAVHALAARRRDLTLHELQHGFVDRLRSDLFESIGAADWSFLARTHSAELSHALTVDLARVNQSTHALLQIAVAAPLAAIYATMALRLSPVSTLAALGAAAVLLLVLPRRRDAHALGEELQRTSKGLHAEVSEFLAGLRLAKSGNAEAALAERFSARLDRARANGLAFSRAQANDRARLRVGAALLVAAVAFISLRWEPLAPASALVLVALILRLLPLLSQAQQSYGLLLNTLPAYEAFRAMRARCRAAVEPRDRGTSYPLADAIELHDVGYRHADADGATLDGVSFRMPCNSTTALVGPSGAGKSTVADLLAGLLAPSSGRITVDGRTLDDPRAWRRQVAYVPQDGFLFNASVRDNLLWAASTVGDEELHRVLSLAAADFVFALPQGLDTVLGERGLRLSGGERQRLAIARALLRKPALLILDEATSALDRDNELRIQGALDNLHGQVTILIIAHRQGTLRNADQIIVIEDGRVIERDPAAVLAARVR